MNLILASNDITTKKNLLQSEHSQTKLEINLFFLVPR
jgi:hypothetical protein